MANVKGERRREVCKSKRQIESFLPHDLYKSFKTLKSLAYKSEKIPEQG